MELIFLDFDGVMNSQLFWAERSQKERRVHYRKKYLDGDALYRGADIDENSINMLNNLVKKTNSQVVVSSTWRNHVSLEDLQTIMNRKGFQYQLFGKTPKLRCEGLKASVPRGLEIQAFLINNFPDHKERDKVRYVILDDDSDMLLWQKDNYFQVDPYCGLTPNIVYRATRFLNRED